MTPPTPPAPPAPPLVPAFRRGAWQPSLDTVALPGATGTRLALVPEIVAAADRRWWDATAPTLPAAPAPPHDRRELLLRALDLYEKGDLPVGSPGLQSGDDFRAALWESAGLPAPLVDRWCAMLRTALLSREVPSSDEALALVSLPGNTFTCLDAVLEQLERSAGVWVRPSRREPFSAARLVAALVAAGWPGARIGFYPGDRRTLHGLTRLTDRHTVFGGAGLAASVRASAALTVHGPGRGCALVPEDMAVGEAVDWLLPLIAADSGRFCSNVRTVVCAGPAEPLATALASALDAIRPEPVDPVWPLTAFREPGAAERAAATVTDRMLPGDRLLTRRAPVVQGATGTFALPQLILIESEFERPENHPLVGHEVLFPFATVVGGDNGGDNGGEGSAAAAIAARSLFVHRPPNPPNPPNPARPVKRRTP